VTNLPYWLGAWAIVATMGWWVENTRCKTFRLELDHVWKCYWGLQKHHDAMIAAQIRRNLEEPK